MSSKDEARIFVGGLSWDTTDRQLEDAFSRFGKVVEAQVMLERDTGRPRGFGFVTFTDRRAMDDAIAEMHGQDLGGRNISVNKAQPKMGSDDSGYGYGDRDRGYSSGSRGGFRGGDRGDRDRPPVGGSSDCFKCGRPGHWARECPSAGGGGGGGGGGRLLSRPRFGGGNRFEGGDHYVDDRYDGGRYGDRDRDRFESRDAGRYGGGGGGRDRYASDRDRDRYGGDRYPAVGGDRYYGGSGGGDRYGGGADRYPQNGYGKEKSYDRDGGPRGGGGGVDRYGSGGPMRYEAGGGYRERPAPYDRPARGGRPSPYDR